MILHPMENGFNVDSQGTTIPVHIISDFVCRYLGQQVVRVKLEPGLAANPYFSFFLKASKSGPVDFEWTDQDGTHPRLSDAEGEMTTLHHSSAVLLLLAVAWSAGAAPPAKSGFAYLTPETQQLQSDDFRNPGMLWVEKGRSLWATADATGKSCASCHDSSRMAQAVVRYPRYVDAAREVINLEQQIIGAAQGIFIVRPGIRVRGTARHDELPGAPGARTSYRGRCRRQSGGQLRTRQGILLSTPGAI